jgi:hypothetical protein
MAKGLAVISGSNDVVFKALESGIIQAGSATTSATFTITGSLLLSGAAEPVLQLEGLVNTATASFGTDTVLIKSGSYVKEATTLSGNIVLLNDGTNIEDKINVLESGLGASALTVSSSTGNAQVDLDTEALKIVGTANEVEVALTESGSDVQFQVGLPDAVTVTDSLTITGGAGNKLIITQGDIDVQNGAISASSDIETGGKVVAASDITGSANLKILGSGSVDGDFVIAGDLTVQGNTTVIDTSNLTVEDAIILVGSGSNAGSADLGIVFGTLNQRALGIDTGVFTLGTVSPADDTLDGNLTVSDDGTLQLGLLSASIGVYVTGSSGLVVGSNTTSDLKGDVILGASSSETITINGIVTGSGNIIVSSSMTIGDATNVNSETLTLVSPTRMPIFSVSGTYAVAEYPQVPTEYITSASNYSGHSFYITSSNTGSGGVPGDEGDSNFLQGNKWYFNERGVWHASFFYSGS